MDNAAHAPQIHTADYVTYYHVGDGLYRAECPRCTARGRMNEYAHVSGGLCFACHGSRISGPSYTPEKIAKLARQRIARREREARKAAESAARELAERGAKFAAWQATTAGADVLANLDTVPAGVNDFADELRAAVADQLIPTDRAAEILDKIAAQHRADAARDYVGEIGDKITATATVKARVALDGTFGARLLIVAENDTATYKTIGTGATLWGLATGDVVTISGTVKAHELYRGARQTVLTRVKATAQD